MYNDINIDPSFTKKLKSVCASVGGDTNLSPLDPIVAKFNTKYFSKLIKYKGLLHSNQELFKGDSTNGLVMHYSKIFKVFSSNFAASMIKTGNMKPLSTEHEGEIRINCRKVN